MTDGMKALLDVMKRLRDPQTGCPWDIEQTFASIAPYTIEEAYEVADAITRGDMRNLKEELGDLLLQVVFHAQMAEEQGLFNVDDVAQAEADKLISRHPHVFGDQKAANAAEVLDIWLAQKDKEKKGSQTYLLDSITKGLPALMRAQKIHRKVAKIGFDWPNNDGVINKMHEELAELKDAIDQNDKAAQQEELGDVLFTLCVLAEHLGVDAETALRQTNEKFISRFNRLETLAGAQNTPLPSLSLDDMDKLWNTAKTEEKSRKAG